jgi:LmbE family N-acetylglucosaminyl deacetylase
VKQQNLRILAFGAHADDLEILCAGTLARWAEQGHQLVMATATWCKFGCYELSLEACSKLRHAEAAKSAALLGAEYRTLMFPDDGVNPYDPEQQRQVVELIRQTRPEVIVTHAPTDYHTDHYNVSELVKWSGPVLGIPQYQTDSTALDYNPALFYMDTLNGRSFEPTTYVDISQTLETKLAMMKCFESQLGYLKQYFDFDILEQVETVARYRGIQAGVRYAEAFRRHSEAGWGNLTRRYLP